MVCFCSDQKAKNAAGKEDLNRSPETTLRILAKFIEMR